MKIAVLGAGISGLAIAHRLSKEHEVTVFEGRDRPGGNIRTEERHLRRAFELLVAEAGRASGELDRGEERRVVEGPAEVPTGVPPRARE